MNVRRMVNVPKPEDDLEQSHRMTGEMVERARVKTLGQALADTDQSVERARSRRDSLMTRLFPTGLDRAVEGGDVRLVESELEFRLKLLSTVREVQLLGLEQLANNYLRELRALGTERLIDIILDLRARLARKMEDRYEEFRRDMVGRLDAIDRLPERMRDREYERIDEKIYGFDAVVRRLLVEFDEVASERLRVKRLGGRRGNDPA